MSSENLVSNQTGARVGVRAAQVDPLKDLVSLKLESDFDFV
jgi:hypothetical protein